MVGDGAEKNNGDIGGLAKAQSFRYNLWVETKIKTI
jgi:hypothetical protein